MKRANRWVVFLCLAGALSAAPSSAQEDEDATDPALDAAVGDVLVQDEPGHPGVIKVTHICRVIKAGDKARKPGGASSQAVTNCEDPATGYVPWGYSWVGTGNTQFQCLLYPKDSGVVGSDLETAMLNAFAVWVAADAEEIEAPLVKPPVANISTQLSSARAPSRKKDGKNVVSWAALSGTTLAVTQIYISGTKILEFDMTFNKNFAWKAYMPAGVVDPACGTLGSQFDVEHIAAHECGHAYGLSHPRGPDNQLSTADPRLTMYYAGGPGETHNRTLNIGDKDGIKFVY